MGICQAMDLRVLFLLRKRKVCLTQDYSYIFFAYSEGDIPNSLLKMREK